MAMGEDPTVCRDFTIVPIREPRRVSAAGLNDAAADSSLARELRTLRFMPYMHRSKPGDEGRYPQVLFPLPGEENQLLIVNYSTHVGIDILHGRKVLSTTNSGSYRTVYSGDRSSIRIGPTSFFLPTAIHAHAIDWLTGQGIYRNT